MKNWQDDYSQRTVVSISKSSQQSIRSDILQELVLETILF